MPSSACQTCARSEEHTSELQSHDNLVCRLLLEKNRDVSARIAPDERAATCGLAPGPRAAPGRRDCRVAGAREASQRAAPRARGVFFFKDPGDPELLPSSPHVRLAH